LTIVTKEQLFDELFDAMCEADVARVTEILKGEPSLVMQRDESGRTMLSWAVQQGNMEMVQLLVDLGADVNERDSKDGSVEGNSPLHEAAFGPFPSIVAFLIKKGADVESVGKNGQTPIENVAGGFIEEQAPRETMALLFENGSKVTNICVAATLGDIEIIKQLIDQGADPDDSILPQERTALHIAAATGNKPLVKYMLTLTDNVNCEDWSSQTPLELTSDDDIRSILREHGGQTNVEIWDEIYAGLAGAGAVKLLGKIAKGNPEKSETPTVYPPCPDCAAPMRVSTARRGHNSGEQFFRCSRYPQCKATLPLPPFEKHDPQQDR
jgi:ssDNA-binding Zn-finger/Zn-ribbon topoisomerase 1